MSQVVCRFILTTMTILVNFVNFSNKKNIFSFINSYNCHCVSYHTRSNVKCLSIKHSEILSGFIKFKGLYEIQEAHVQEDHENKINAFTRN